MMRRMIPGLVVLGILQLAGCGGGGSSSGGSPSSFQVQIQSTRVVPKSNTISTADTVQFVNTDSQSHQVVSGHLTPQGSPLVIHTITISNTGFAPDTTEADLGDTVRVSNASMSTFLLNLVDDNGNVVSSFTIPVGNLQDLQFSSAGRYTVQNKNNNLFQGTIFVFGNPTPDGRFQSPILTNGGVFNLQLVNVGAYPYFVPDSSNPSRSFITGTINVQ